MTTGLSRVAATEPNHGLRGLLPNRNDRESSALSHRETLREARVRARIDSIFRKSCPHPALLGASRYGARAARGHPLPEGEGPRSKIIPVGQQPLRPWLGSVAATRLSKDAAPPRLCFEVASLS